jgi:hypothetical protein
MYTRVKIYLPPSLTLQMTSTIDHLCSAIQRSDLTTTVMYKFGHLKLLKDYLDYLALRKPSKYVSEVEALSDDCLDVIERWQHDTDDRLSDLAIATLKQHLGGEDADSGSEDEVAYIRYNEATRLYRECLHLLSLQPIPGSAPGKSPEEHKCDKPIHPFSSDSDYIPAITLRDTKVLKSYLSDDGENASMVEAEEPESRNEVKVKGVRRENFIEL